MNLSHNVFVSLSPLKLVSAAPSSCSCIKKNALDCKCGFFFRLWWTREMNVRTIAGKRVAS